MIFDLVRRSLLIFALTATGCAPSSNEFTAVNRSGKKIQRMEVAVSGKRFSFTDIPGGGTITQSYHPTHDSAFVIRTTFITGEFIDATAGYVTNGLEMRHEIAVGSQSITVLLVSVK